jgi:hypothetical protein
MLYVGYSFAAGNYWTLKENRKKFFDSVANRRGLDALNATTWYNTSRGDIVSVKVARANKMFLFIDSLICFIGGYWSA